MMLYCCIGFWDVGEWKGRKNMWILVLLLIVLVFLVGVYGLFWLIECGGDEYLVKFLLSDKGVMEFWCYWVGIRNSEFDGEGFGSEIMLWFVVIFLFVVIVSVILVLSLLFEVIFFVWCVWGLLGIFGVWLLFVLVVGWWICFDLSLDWFCL